MGARPHATEKGQAIVLVALVMLVLLGFLGLAMDGGRAYVDRREMQDSVDAAALAAAYDCMNSSTLCIKNGSYAQSENVAVSFFAENERLYATPSCTGLGSLSATCTFGDPTGQTLTVSVANRSTAGLLFTATATHQIPVAIMQVLGARPTISIGASATAVARQPDSGAAIQTLSPAGCGGNNGTSLSFKGTSTAILTGDVWSNGNIDDTNNAGGTVSGNVVAACGTIPLMPTFTVSGTQSDGTTLPDPGFTLPALNGTSQAWGSSDYNVVRQPGTYSGSVSLTSGCWFLSGGAYDFAGGLKNTGGFISNELRPPDEPVYNNNTVRATYQFWDTNQTGYGLGPASGKNQCSGEFLPYATGSDSSNPPVNPTTYAVEVTSVAWTPFGAASCSGPASPTCFLRESSPSMCRTVTLGNNQVLKTWIENVPGAAYYNVYVAPNGSCAGPFGYVGPAGCCSINNNVAEQNKALTGCNPSLAGLTSPPALSSCDLGSVSGTFNGNAFSGWSINANAARDTAGAPPPDGEAAPVGPALPNVDAATGTPPRGDAANENYCANSAGTWVACPSTITPGAVFLYIPGPGSNTQCLDLEGGGSDYLYSGYQFGRILLYEPGALQSPPANTCPNNVTGGNLTSLLGIFYIPGASMTIAGNSSYYATIAGGLIAWTATIQGSGGVSITADQSLRFPGAVQLVK